MKKSIKNITAIILALVLTLAVFAGCDKNPNEETTVAETTTGTNIEPTTEPTSVEPTSEVESTTEIEPTTEKPTEKETEKPEPSTKKPVEKPTEPPTKRVEPSTKKEEPSTKKPEPVTEKPTEPTTKLDESNEDLNIMGGDYSPARAGMMYDMDGNRIYNLDTIKEGNAYIIYSKNGNLGCRIKPISPENMPDPFICSYCGKKNCHRLLMDGNCYDCGVFLKAGVCHQCQ